MVLLLAVSMGVFAQDGGLPVLEIDDLEHERLRAPVEYLQTTADATFEEVRGRTFQPLEGAAINQGITGAAFWLRMRLANPDTERASVWVLHHESSYLDHFHVHYADAGGPFRVERLSDRQPFAERPIDYRRLAFTHRTPAGSHTDIYLRLGYERPDSMSLNVHLWEEERFRHMVMHENLAHGAYFGAMLVLFAFAIAAGTLLRQMTYFHYAAFLLASGLMWATINGFSFQYLWPRSVFWHNEGFHIIYLLVAITALQFSKSFLQTARLMPYLHHGVTALQALMAAGIAARFAGFYVEVLYLSYAALSILALLPLLAWLAFRRGLQYVRWYALAWTVYAAGLVVGVLSAATGMFTWGMESPLIYAQGAGVLEAVLLLVALGERLLSWDADRRQALRLANQDPLTGLGNRRLLTQSYQVFTERFLQTGEPVFLLMIDLDHFKRVNDTYGHEAGDRVLRQMGRLLRRTSRSGDICIRYGGEEFAVLLQAPRLDDAQRIAERIREEFARNPTRHQGAWIQHTLSAGLTAVLSAREELTAPEMMRRADAALYQAKAAGRNRVTVYLPDPVGDG